MLAIGRGTGPPQGNVAEAATKLSDAWAASAEAEVLFDLAVCYERLGRTADAMRRSVNISNSRPRSGCGTLMNALGRSSRQTKKLLQRQGRGGCWSRWPATAKSAFAFARADIAPSVARKFRNGVCRRSSYVCELVRVRG
jgi:hypothetical protein